MLSVAITHVIKLLTKLVIQDNIYYCRQLLSVAITHVIKRLTKLVMQDNIYYCRQLLSVAITHVIKRLTKLVILQTLLDYMTTVGYHQKVYTLMTSFPRRNLSDDLSHTLDELGLTSSLVLNVEERDTSLCQD